MNGSTDPTDPKEKLVLIVDDDDSVLELLEYIIRKEGFRLEKAGDGQEALRKAKELHPSVVVLDLMLPRYGGFEVLRELQAGETASIPILVITGRFNDRSTKEMIRQESNVVDFLEKPLKPPLLLSILHRVLGTRPPLPKKEGGPSF